MIEIVHGGLDGDPLIFANVNVNSPLHFDVRMLEGLLAYAEAGQALIVTPFLLMGAMAPVSVPAALVQQTVEVLAGVALAQLVRPGTPCIMGSFLSATDMQSGSPAFGGPESGGRPLRVRAGGAPTRPAVAVGGRHAHRQPVGRLPGRLRVVQHDDRRLPRRRERVLAVGGLAARAGSSRRSRSSRRTARSSTCSSASSRRLRSTTPASPSTPTSRSARAAHFFGAQHTLERLPHLLLAADRRLDRELRPLDEERLARPRSPRLAPLAGDARRVRARRRSTRRSRRSSSSSSSAGPPRSATRSRFARTGARTRAGA